MIYHEEIFKALNKARVKYVATGGVAVVLYGYMRMTQDLDLYVFLEDKNLSKLFDVLVSMGYKPKVSVTKEQFIDHKQREKWKKEKNMIVFSFEKKDPPFDLIDIFVDEPIAFKNVYENRKLIRVDKTQIPLMGIDHLIKLKKLAGRAVDLEDIAQLNEIRRMSSGK